MEYNHSNGSTLRLFTYGHDNNGNITSRNVAGTSFSYTYDELDRIAASTQNNEAYAYDARGNRVTLSSDTLPSLPAAEYEYDRWNRLTGVETDEGAAVSYRYNGDGMLYERHENGEITRYYTDGPHIVAEARIVNGAAQNPVSYIRGNGLVARKAADGTKSYYVTDGHGDVMELRSASQAVLNQYTYNLWGVPTVEAEAVDNPFLYAGEYYDQASGLQYLRSRWYDPSMGRFMNKDTYQGDISNPLSLNLYTYVYNNPLRYTDPSGHCIADWLGQSYCEKLWEDLKSAVANTNSIIANQANVEWEIFLEIHSSVENALEFWSGGTVAEIKEYNEFNPIFG